MDLIFNLYCICNAFVGISLVVGGFCSVLDDGRMGAIDAAMLLGAIGYSVFSLLLLTPLVNVMF